MFKGLVFAASFSLFLPLTYAAQRDPSQGQITSPIFSLTYGNAPGQDQFTLSGNLAYGSNAPALSLPSDVVVLSLDGGHFSNTFATNAFTCGGSPVNCTYNHGNYTFSVKSDDNAICREKKDDYKRELCYKSSDKRFDECLNTGRPTSPLVDLPEFGTFRGGGGGGWNPGPIPEPIIL